jgi:hypothetical protein
MAHLPRAPAPTDARLNGPPMGRVESLKINIVDIRKLRKVNEMLERE